MLFGQVGDCNVITMYYYCNFRANNGAVGTACAIGVVCLCGKVAVFVGLFRDNDAALRAYCNTQATAFAAFSIDYYFTSHFLIFTCCPLPSSIHPLILTVTGWFVKTKGNYGLQALNNAISPFFIFYTRWLSGWFFELFDFWQVF